MQKWSRICWPPHGTLQNWAFISTLRFQNCLRKSYLQDLTYVYFRCESTLISAGTLDRMIQVVLFFAWGLSWLIEVGPYDWAWSMTAWLKPGIINAEGFGLVVEVNFIIAQVLLRMIDLVPNLGGNHFQENAIF